MSKELHGQFTISQGAVIENQRGEVLILKLAGGGWGIPGGHLHANEDWLAGLKREIFEETGIRDFTVNGVGGVSLWKSNYGIWFRCAVPANSCAIVLSNEHTDFAWILDAKDVERYSFCHPAIKECVLKVLATK